MTLATIVFLVMIACGVALGAFTLLAPRKEDRPVAAAQAPLEPWSTTTGWTVQAGEEFAALSESARCDLIFAVADLRDEQSRGMLLHALDDPSETVALAAAHVLAQRGDGKTVRAYAQRHPSERAQRITQTLELLG